MEKILERVGQALQQHEPQGIGNPKKFSVLLPLIKVKDEWHVLYEIRSENISQPGESAFPGGAIEKDECPADAAIRETMEELLIKREQITLLGEMDYILTETMIIYCFVGYLEGIDVKNQPVNGDEVAALYSIPLSMLKKYPPNYYKIQQRPVADEEDDFPYHQLRGGRDYPFSRRVSRTCFYHLPQLPAPLWGFTASLTDRFVEIVNQFDHDLYESLTKNP